MGEILTRDALVAQVAGDRAAGLTVAFANGCFDLLHVGHTRYLQAAAAEGDRLVVAINDELELSPGRVNEDPYGEGWICEIELSDPAELDDLIDAASYSALIEG